MFGSIYQFLLSLLTQVLAFFGLSFGNSKAPWGDSKAPWGDSKASADPNDDSNADSNSLVHATASDSPAPPALEPLPMDHTDALAPAQ